MKQEEYIAILFNDCGFRPSQARDFLASRYGGRRYSDELTTEEKHTLIEFLKEHRAGEEEAA